MNSNSLAIASLESKDGREIARRLLEDYGAAPLLFFSLLPDKRYLGDSAKTPRWAVAYRALGRHALALGDPLGSPGAAPEAIAAFCAFCRSKGRTPAFYQVTPEHLDTYKAAGFRAVKVGEDAQIDLVGYDLAGKRFKNVRNDLRRIEKAGVVLEVYGPDAPPPDRVTAEMDAISAAWRSACRAKEGAFAMGAFDPKSALFAESRYFVARDTETGRMLAFTSFVPAFGADGQRDWTLDLMRRRADALHGVMDFLIISAARQFAAEGARTLSLGLSPLAGAGEAGEARAAALTRRFLYARMGRVYNFAGLHTFKSKFATHWEPRYLVHRPGVGLAAASAAVLQAHLTTPPPPGTGPRPLGLRTPRGRQVFAVTALLLLGLAPFEKTLAHTALHRPHLSLHLSLPLHRAHFPHLAHFPHHWQV